MKIELKVGILWTFAKKNLKQKPDHKKRKNKKVDFYPH